MESHDTIIVGAGSAGCVLAARLGEESARRILVLEAGGEDDHWFIHLPLGVGKVWSDPRWNWSYTGEPEPHADNRRIPHPRGKVVGGSSSINIMAYVRCHRLDYDRLPQLGLKGWSYADALPYFKRAERFAGGGDLYRGDAGPLQTRENPARDYVYDAFLAAAPELGYRVNQDYNGAEQAGFGRRAATSRSAPAPTRPGSCSRAGARSASNMSKTESGARRAPRTKSFSAAGPTTRRSFCCCRASDRPPNCASSASSRAPISPASARICGTTRCWRRSGCASRRAASTAACGSTG
jgi:choline dehydrogenase-like flavoprotein